MTFFAISGCFSLLVLIVSTFSPAANAKCDCNTVCNLVKGMKMQLTDIQKKLESRNQGEKLYSFAVSLVNRKFNAADDFQRTIQEIIQIKFDVCFSFVQSTRTVPSCTNPAERSVVFIQSILMVQARLMCSVTKQQPVGGGQCSRRDWTARSISTAAGTTTNWALVT